MTTKLGLVLSVDVYRHPIANQLILQFYVIESLNIFLSITSKNDKKYLKFLKIFLE